MKTFRDAIRRDDLVVTADLPLKPATSASDISKAVEVLAPAIDAVQIDDNRYLPEHMSPLAAASIVLGRGLDAVVHLSCRDRNRVALRADILGAAAIGVTSMVLARGDKLVDKQATRAKGVFDTSGTQLVAIASQSGADPRLAASPGPFIGCFATVFDPAEDWEATRIEEKLDAGARFLQTQPCLNADLIRRYVDKLVQRRVLHRASLVVEVPLLTSPQETIALREVYRGAPVPDAAIKRIASADDPVREGVSICAEMLTELRCIPGISGVNVHYRGDPRNVVAAIRKADLAN